MNMFRYAAMSLVLVICVCLGSCKRQIIQEFHVFEINEILLTAEDRYDNPYTDVECWVDLEGPGFSKRIYGFWDGGQQFKVRVTAIQPGDWSWKSGSTSTSDMGLNDKSGNFRAIAWTEQEKEANDNRRGFVRPTANGRALEYADGTPFFFIGDTWWAATTWRYPLPYGQPVTSLINGARHITYGTGAYDGTAVGEEEGARPYIWDGLNYPAGEQVGYLRKFMESEGGFYKKFKLASQNLHPRKSAGSKTDGLDGWAFMIWLEDKSLAMLYFENKCEAPGITSLIPDKEYQMKWFDPMTGEWLADVQNVSTNEEGRMLIEKFPDGEKISTRDWSLKLISN